MEEITKYVLALLETVELELGLAKAGIGQLGRGLIVFLIGFLFLFVGILALTWAVYVVLSRMFGAAPAALLAAVILLLCGGGLVWAARRILK
jgi:hypothetical protein